MSNLASGNLAAKLELFPNEASSQINSPPTDKQVYLLENVTAVEPCHSKTHKLAFQIVQITPILVLCSDSQGETDLWISAFKQIFLPNQAKDDGMFRCPYQRRSDKTYCTTSKFFWQEFLSFDIFYFLKRNYRFQTLYIALYSPFEIL